MNLEENLSKLIPFLPGGLARSVYRNEGVTGAGNPFPKNEVEIRENRRGILYEAIGSEMIRDLGTLIVLTYTINSNPLVIAVIPAGVYLYITYLYGLLTKPFNFEEKKSLDKGE